MLPYACIDSILLVDEFSIYFSRTEQDEYGRIVRTWEYDRTERGLVQQIRKEMYAVGEQNMWNDVLLGQSEEDLRIDSNGNLYAPSEVLVLVIKPNLYETAGPRKGLSTIYELRASSPVEGPFGEVLYFNIELVRSIDQVTLQYNSFNNDFSAEFNSGAAYVP